MNCRKCGQAGVDGTKTTYCQKCSKAYEDSCKGLLQSLHEAEKLTQEHAKECGIA